MSNLIYNKAGSFIARSKIDFSHILECVGQFKGHRGLEIRDNFHAFPCFDQALPDVNKFHTPVVKHVSFVSRLNVFRSSVKKV